MPQPRRQNMRLTMVGAVPVLIGAWFAGWAIQSDRTWFDRHWLENYCAREKSTLVGEGVARAVALGVALTLVLVVRPRLMRWVARKDGKDLLSTVGGVAIAVALALVFCDWLLRRTTRSEDPLSNPDFPPMRIDETGNLSPVPARETTATVGGRTVVYATDADGNRAARANATLDPTVPTIVFTGESFALGWGVAYEKTCAALVGAALGATPVNLAVVGFSNDQAYSRLRDALPKLARPVAVVTFMLPDQLQRNVNERRERLALSNEGHLELVPASHSLLATSPLRRLFPYHSDEAVRLSHAIVRATVDLARARGARPLFVFTNYGSPCMSEGERGSWLERNLFDDLGTPHVRVEIPPGFVIASPTDMHPNEQGHRLLADAIVRALSSSAPSLGR